MPRISLAISLITRRTLLPNKGSTFVHYCFSELSISALLIHSIFSAVSRLRCIGATDRSFTLTITLTLTVAKSQAVTATGSKAGSQAFASLTLPSGQK